MEEIFTRLYNLFFLNTVKLHNNEYQISWCAECRWAKIDQISIDNIFNYADTARRINQYLANVTRKYISTPVPIDVAVI
jgi:hypothetical protein